MIAGLTLSIVIIVLVTLFYLVHLWLIRRYDPLREKGSSGSLSYTVMALAAAALIIAQPAILPWLGFYTTARWGLFVQLFGLAFFAGAMALHWWARIHLQQFFGERIEVQKEQHLIDKGPYAHVRHPIYTSFFLMMIGLVLLNPALPTLLVAAATFWDYGKLVSQEEEMLSQSVPGYKEYLARTTRFFPKLRKG
ncbi:MAG: isoprenylcysteine carboxylmethyltransferase family protein [Chloroflexi bacterium]|nr:isoprenylcysteine carboxylmethyltransferase family protein [Chloroflexota bacterium]MCI0578566.1 isoprenylcysteine carboxylmethyltransferase family protein [Chloroflexota bacterium]MCI0645086.1 isoprenylcysteine carboxylmethyltransferase family protein [Chloroflexota bacterium]MCI0731921.1 isoprenylcysteine carboxylmethyltransferase family protein [Chloroflexota bacterium]